MAVWRVLEGKGGSWEEAVIELHRAPHFCPTARRSPSRPVGACRDACMVCPRRVALCVAPIASGVADA